MSEGDTGFWLEVEKRYGKEKLDQIIREHRENTELASIITELRDKLPVSVFDVTRQHILQSIPPQAQIPEFVRAELDSRINAVLLPYAQRIRQQRLSLKQERQNFAQEMSLRISKQDIARYALQIVTEMIPTIQKLRTANTFYAIPFNDDMNLAASYANSFNAQAETLSIFGYSLPTIPVPDLSHPQKRHSWLLDVQSEKILSDTWIQQTRAILSRLAS